MSLRTRLLLLSLLTLILPWAGCRYAQQMEATMREGQEEALLTTARSIARVVSTETELLYRDLSFSTEFDSQAGDLFAAELMSPPLLDGFADEWPQPARDLPAGAFGPEIPRVGLYRHALYAFLSTNRERIVYENPASANPGNSDRVVVLTGDTQDGEQAWCLSAVAPGPVIARRCSVGSPWTAVSEPEQDISGIWRATSQGFDVELRLPLRLIGTRFAVFAIDPHGLSTHKVASGRLHMASEALRSKLEVYAPEGLRISVVDAHGWLLAQAGKVFRGSSDPAPLGSEADSLYRIVLGRTEERSLAYGLPYGMWGRPVDSARAGKEDTAWFEPANGEPSTVRAAVPIMSQGNPIGALMVEQAGDRLLLRRDAALTQLLNFTLMATVIAVVSTLAFAGWLLRRIRRLSRATATALTPEGRIQIRIPDTDADHELGDLARSFAALLGRLKDYTDYLQTLGAKLSHELRTPLTIVSSSLENLSLEKLPAEARPYVERARGGSARLHALLTAMTEATRVEQSIEHAERTDFDLAALVRTAGQSYQQSFANHRIELALGQQVCSFYGAPEIIAQMLDKLMDNAIDFCPPGKSIEIRLAVDPRFVELSVANEGPVLAPGLESTLFDSLVSGRTSSGDRPHLGLGLYIVRLIADFHGGQATARNLPNSAGVIFTIRLPQQASDARHIRDKQH
jgi:dedicated sortase system histidine kinase